MRHFNLMVFLWVSKALEFHFITEDRMFVDKHLINSSRAKAMKSGFSCSLTTLGILALLMLALTGCDEEASKEGLVLHLSFKAGEESELEDKGFKLVCGSKNPPCTLGREENRLGREGVFSAGLNAKNWNWLEILDHSYLSPADEITLSAWILPKNHRCSSEGFILAPHGHKIVGKTNANFDGGYVLGISTNPKDKNYSLFAEIWDAKGKKHRLIGGKIPFGEWTHVAMTWRSGENMKGYVNGQNVGVIDASKYLIGTNKERLRIGIAPWDTNALAFGGSIDEVRLNHTQLGDDEIKNLYERTNVRSAMGLKYKPRC